MAQFAKQIEAGEFGEKQETTFPEAAKKYMLSGGERQFLPKLLDYFRGVGLSRIGQAAIEEAALALYPTATPATRNRQVYTPVSAVLKHAGHLIALKRPKGAQGEQRLEWLRDENEAGRLFMECHKVDPELAALVITLVYTGMRLGECLKLTCRDLDWTQEPPVALCGKTKNGEPRLVVLPPYAVVTLRTHPRGIDRGDEPIFRFKRERYLYTKLARATKAAGVPWFTFHSARHTWATWMRRFGGLDTRGLVGTGAWRDQKSANRYAHTVSTEEARKALVLPVPKQRSVG